jgi:hypothetical protein
MPSHHHTGLRILKSTERRNIEVIHVSVGNENQIDGRQVLRLKRGSRLAFNAHRDYSEMDSRMVTEDRVSKNAEAIYFEKDGAVPEPGCVNARIGPEGGIWDEVGLQDGPLQICVKVSPEAGSGAVGRIGRAGKPERGARRTDQGPSLPIAGALANRPNQRFGNKMWVLPHSFTATADGPACSVRNPIAKSISFFMNLPLLSPVCDSGRTLSQAATTSATRERDMIITRWLVSRWCFMNNTI